MRRVYGNPAALQRTRFAGSVVRLNGPSNLTVRAGDSFDLDAAKSIDPDGDSLSFFWFQYREAGSYPGTVALGLRSKLNTIRGLRAPTVTKPETIHFIELSATRVARH